MINQSHINEGELRRRSEMDRAAARSKLELARTAELVRGGMIRPDEADTRSWQLVQQSVQMSVRVDDYIAELKSRGVSMDRVTTTETYLRADGCSFRFLRDLNAETGRMIGLVGYEGQNHSPRILNPLCRRAASKTSASSLICRRTLQSFDDLGDEHDGNAF